MSASILINLLPIIIPAVIVGGGCLTGSDSGYLLFARLRGKQLVKVHRRGETFKTYIKRIDRDRGLLYAPRYPRSDIGTVILNEATMTGDYGGAVTFEFL